MNLGLDWIMGLLCGLCEMIGMKASRLYEAVSVATQTVISLISECLSCKPELITWVWSPLVLTLSFLRLHLQNYHSSSGRKRSKLKVQLEPCPLGRF